MSSSSNPVTPAMTAEELREFLRRPYLMDLATISPDGYPHVTPVWFEYDGKAFLVSTMRERKKAGNILRDSKVGFSVAQPNLPYAGVVGYGNAEVSDDLEGELLRRLAKKYLPQDQTLEYFKELMLARGSRIILRITPAWMLNWTGE